MRLCEPGRLPEISDVRYVISWQKHDDKPIPPSLESREDVKVVKFNGIGLSRNRNNSLNHCSADIILIADDDLIFHPEGIESLRKRYEENPEMQVATFRSRRNDNNKSYPPDMTKLGIPMPKNYYVTSFEISLRGYLKDKLKFSPDLGLNAPQMHSGEEEIFLLSAIKKGLNCRFVDVEVCDHPDVSTGLGKQTRQMLEGVGCVITLLYPSTAFLRIPLKAWRLWRNRQSSLLSGLIYMTIGAFRSRSIDV